MFVVCCRCYVVIIFPRVLIFVCCFLRVVRCAVCVVCSLSCVRCCYCLWSFDVVVHYLLLEGRFGRWSCIVRCVLLSGVCCYMLFVMCCCMLDVNVVVCCCFLGVVCCVLFVVG